MTPLERALHERIKAEGPITVEAFMEACNTYYYATRDPFGTVGDFTTAPEISQMFGEMVGACLADCWLRAGPPVNAAYTELGPGRGTLAADALRVMRSAGFGGDVHFVETSPILREAQRAAVGDAHWFNSVDDLPQEPQLIVANEFLDALPVQQFIQGTERRVMIVGGGFAFDRDGQTVELSPIREEIVRAIARRLTTKGGVALFIDYGHARIGRGDTLQAVRGHRFSPVLANPGEQDLTSHVDFETVERAGREAGASVTRIVTQGDWLKRLGIEARAAGLTQSNPERADDIRSAVERLTSAEHMGELFKVIAIHSADWPAPAGFE